MSQFFDVHPTHPQARLLKQAAELLLSGAVAIYPTDSSYALGCTVGNKEAADRIRRLRGLDDDHHFSLVCRDLSELATYAKVDNTAFRLLKSLTPGPYTFIFKATHEVPRRLQHPKRRSIGIRVPDHPVTRGLLEVLDAPLLSTTLVLPGEALPLTDPLDIRERLEKQVDVIIASGAGDVEPTTVLDFLEGVPEVVRPGKGSVDFLTP